MTLRIEFKYTPNNIRCKGVSTFNCCCRDCLEITDCFIRHKTIYENDRIVFQN